MTAIEIIDEYRNNKSHILSKEEEIELFEYLYAHPEDKELIQTILIIFNKGLIISICRKYHPICNVDFDDIIQFAHLGLLQAIEKFDITKNTKFSSYATFWIKQRINRELQKLSLFISQPIRVSDIRKKYYEVENELSQLYRREVTFYEVANKMGISYSDLELILTLSDSSIISLNKESSDNELIDFIDDPQDDELIEKRELILESLKQLNEKEKEVILYRYGYVDGMYHTMEETGNKLGCTRQRVQQLEKEALRTMRQYIKNNQS